MKRLDATHRNKRVKYQVRWSMRNHYFRRHKKNYSEWFDDMYTGYYFHKLSLNSSLFFLTRSQEMEAYIIDRILTVKSDTQNLF